jgi:uncharacterized membrane protein
MALAHAPVLFETLIVPYRSLTAKGVLAVIAVFVILSSAIALRFWIMGAWPVVACCFIDLPLLAVLLLINVRRARARELIMLDTAQLTVIRTNPDGRRKQVSLPAAWLRIDLDAGKGVPRIVARSHGRGCEVGAFLHEPEKTLLYEALTSALHQARNPRFDNPQLQES